MKTLTPFFCALSLILLQSSLNADGLYKWKDAKGVTQYGDRPPANVNAEPMSLPKITIIEKYAEQWKPMKFDDTNNNKQAVVAQVKTASNTYTKLSFLAPKSNQAIRANDGDVTAMISIKPALKKGHKLVFSIDGKSMPKSSSRTKNFSGLTRGNHIIGVKVVDTKGKTIKSSNVGFNVLRVSSLSNTKINQAEKLPQALTYENAKKQQN